MSRMAAGPYSASDRAESRAGDSIVLCLQMGALGLEPSDTPCQQRTYNGAAQSIAQLETEIAPETPITNPDLNALIRAWPVLPDAIRAGIVAMVNLASGAK